MSLDIIEYIYDKICNTSTYIVDHVTNSLNFKAFSKLVDR